MELDIYFRFTLDEAFTSGHGMTFYMCAWNENFQFVFI